jgi:hypothetical protein
MNVIFFQDLLDTEEYIVAVKQKQNENPFLDQQPSPRQALVDMKGDDHIYLKYILN